MWIYSAYTNARAMSKYETEHNHLSPPARQELFKRFNQNLFKCFYLLRLVLNWCETHSGKHGTSLRKAKVTQASCRLKKTLTGLSQNLKPNIGPKYILKYLSFHTETCLWNINPWMRKIKNIQDTDDSPTVDKCAAKQIFTHQLAPTSKIF